MREAVGDSSLAGFDLMDAFEKNVEPTLMQPTIIYDWIMRLAKFSSRELLQVLRPARISDQRPKLSRRRLPPRLHEHTADMVP